MLRAGSIPPPHTQQPSHRPVVGWLREFCRTLEIIARTLREVVHGVRLYGHYARRGSRGEVHVYGAVMRRWGEGVDYVY